MAIDKGGPLDSSATHKKRLTPITNSDRSGISGVFMLCGGGILTLGAVMIRFYGIERAGILVASIGILLAATGAILGARFHVEKGNRAYTRYRFFLRLFAGLFLGAAALWNAVDGLFGLCHYSRLFHGGIQAKALDLCLLAGLQFVIGAGGGFVSIMLLRGLKDTPSFLESP